MSPLIYIVIIAAANLIGFAQMGIDKRLAVKRRRRIPEIQLIAPALLGGIIGIILGMLTFRHKTSKFSFQFKLALAVALFGELVYLLFFHQAR